MPTTKWCRTFIDVRQSALDLEPEDATDLTAQQFRYGGWVLAAKQPVLICCGLALASVRGLTLAWLSQCRNSADGNLRVCHHDSRTSEARCVQRRRPVFQPSCTTAA